MSSNTRLIVFFSFFFTTKWKEFGPKVKIFFLSLRVKKLRWFVEYFVSAYLRTYTFRRHDSCVKRSGNIRTPVRLRRTYDEYLALLAKSSIYSSGCACVGRKFTNVSRHFRSIFESRFLLSRSNCTSRDSTRSRLHFALTANLINLLLM